MRTAPTGQEDPRVKQATLFPDESAATSGALSAAPGIAKPSRALRPAQRRFNTLLKQVEKLRAELARWHHFTDEHMRRIGAELAPRAARLREEQIVLARLLDRQMTHAGLGKRHRALLRELLIGLLSTLLEEEESPELIALYDRYASVSRADEQRLDFELLQALADDLPGDFGPYEGKPNAEDFAAWLHDHLQASEEEAPRRRGKRAEPAKAAQSEGALDAPALRSVFRRLASKLHPDRESDAGEQQRKTALMQELNAAYAAGDLLRVLELQQSVDARAADALADLDDAQLKPYLSVLQRQVKQLRAQIDAHIAPFSSVAPGGRAATLTPEDVSREFERAVRELGQVERHVQEDLKRFADVEQLRAALDSHLQQSRPRRSRAPRRRR